MIRFSTKLINTIDLACVWIIPYYLFSSLLPDYKNWTNVCVLVFENLYYDDCV